ncbi:DUF3440 domain-containing protein [Vibrio maritimus]|uniref:DUF3440 domain-containing protein n=1 Tax=Vibrio maritimus TaxID=990268 RepID=UPI001F1BB5CB|nr:DUF3440 domain-containing protein [Vibrio maritimus]
MDDFQNFYVSFSGGKDSGVLLNIVIEEAKKRNRLPVDVLVVDLEAQYQHTVEYVDSMLKKPEVNAYWVCLPLSLRNSVSQFQPKWLCWNPDEKELWVRKLPPTNSVINDERYFPFFKKGMEFEEFVNQFMLWYQSIKKTTCAGLIAIRSDESLYRYKTIKSKKKGKFKGINWTTYVSQHCYLAYPIYDWSVEDIWAANSKFLWSYNRIYELMHKVGVPLSQQRLCQPFGEDQRKGLWLYQILEPDTWQRLVGRVQGCNFGAKYSKKQGRILGYYRFELPAGHTYRSYAKFLLHSMPPYMEQHYRAKIFQFLVWWKKHGKHLGIRHIPDFADKKLEAQKKVPSWRRICKVLIKNDFLCRGLSFGLNKSLSNKCLENYDSYFQTNKRS